VPDFWEALEVCPPPHDSTGAYSCLLYQPRRYIEIGQRTLSCLCTCDCMPICRFQAASDSMIHDYDRQYLDSVKRSA
jgi:hypothetical protein